VCVHVGGHAVEVPGVRPPGSGAPGGHPHQRTPLPLADTRLVQTAAATAVIDLYRLRRGSNALICRRKFERRCVNPPLMGVSQILAIAACDGTRRLARPGRPRSFELRLERLHLTGNSSLGGAPVRARTTTTGDARSTPTCDHGSLATGHCACRQVLVRVAARPRSCRDLGGP